MTPCPTLNANSVLSVSTVEKKKLGVRVIKSGLGASDSARVVTKREKIKNIVKSVRSSGQRKNKTRPRK
jgi:hypothetical protein